jgi:HAMP domain-containing protein
MVSSVKAYVATDLRPYFLEKNLFHTPGFSGIVATARVAEHFNKTKDRYVIRSDSDNPLNPANSPQRLERDLLERFRSDASLKNVQTEGSLGGERMLVASAPMKSKKGCLRCHGDPASAPQEIVKVYGSGSGYNYKLGDTVGLSVIGVPLADVNAVAVKRSLYAMALLTTLFGVALGMINLLVRRSLISPILEITNAAHEVAKGRIDHTIAMSRDDEIGDLARSVELLRRSFGQLFKRVRRRDA